MSKTYLSSIHEKNQLIRMGKGRHHDTHTHTHSLHWDRVCLFSVLLKSRYVRVITWMPVGPKEAQTGSGSLMWVVYSCTARPGIPTRLPRPSPRALSAALGSTVSFSFMNESNQHLHVFPLESKTRFPRRMSTKPRTSK